MAVKKSMICKICSKEGAQERRVTRSYGHGSKLLVVERVPVVSCPHCGGSYLTADTLHELDQIKRKRKERTARRPVAVAQFG